MRRVSVYRLGAIVALVISALSAQAAAPSDPAQADSYGTVRNIVPAGQRGTINALQLVQVLPGGRPDGR